MYQKDAMEVNLYCRKCQKDVSMARAQREAAPLPIRTARWCNLETLGGLNLAREGVIQFRGVSMCTLM